MGTEQSKTDTNPKVGVSDSSSHVDSAGSLWCEKAGGAPEQSGGPVGKPPVEKKTPATLRKRLEKSEVPTPFVNPHPASGTPVFSRKSRKQTFVRARANKPPVPTFAPPPPIKRPVPTLVQAPLIKPEVQTSAPAFTREPEKNDPEEKCYDPNDPTLTIVDTADELDFLYEEFDSPRALMSCGHAVTPTSLTNWCRWQLDQGYNNFICGTTKCKAKWSFEEVQKMALLTPEEVEYFERKMFDNTKDCFDVKSCPGCKSTVLRKDLDNLCVKCPVCTMDRKKWFNFCWQCLKEWRGPAPRRDRCQNEGCVDEALKTLKNCPEINFRDMKDVTGCPSIRACPTCGLLLEHNRNNCKNVVCSRCKVEFCFVCLQEKKVCGKTSCPYKMCFDGVAPRQTRIVVVPWDVNSPSVCK